METEKLTIAQQFAELGLKFKEAFSPEVLVQMKPIMPPNAASHGHEIDFIIFLIHVLMAVLFVGWGIFFILVLFKFRKKAHPKADYKGVESHATSYIETAVVVIEVLLLIGLSIPFWAKQVNAFPNRGEVVEIRVVAEQFAWNFHYPGEDGLFGSSDPTLVDAQSNPLGMVRDDPNGADDIISSELHLPIGKTALLQITSKDVMHSFAIPVMRVKQDAIPGLRIPMWFTPTKSGTYQIVCNQLCGLNHYTMSGITVIHHEEQFEEWLTDNAPIIVGEGSSDGFDDFWN